MIVKEYLYYQKKYSEIYGPRTIVFMQVGNFYESYATDTEGYNLKEMSDILNIAITKKSKKVDTVSVKYPYLLGFNLNSLYKYMRILMSNGFTVPLIQEVTPPPKPKRELTKIYSPGTYLEDVFTPDSNNILYIYIEDEQQFDQTYLLCMGLTVIDLTTGHIIVNEVYSKLDDSNFAADEAVRFINSYNPKEISIGRKLIRQKDRTIHYMTKDKLIPYLELETRNYRYQEILDKNIFKLSYQTQFLEKVYEKDKNMMNIIETLNLEKLQYATISLILILQFAHDHDSNIINKINKPEIFKNNKYLILGNNALMQLNILNYRDVDYGITKVKSLFNIVNNTTTALGRRFMKNTLISPLLDIKELQTRYNLTEWLIKNESYKKIEEKLFGIMDIERLYRRLSICILHPFEFNNLYESMLLIDKLIKTTCKDNILKKIVPDKKILKKLNKFIKHCKLHYNFDELKLYKMTDINNSFFINKKYKKIDSIQNDINECMLFFDNICKVLSNLIKDKNGLNKNKDDKVKLRQTGSDGYFLESTKLRSKLLQKVLKDKKQVNITDKFILSYDDITFKESKKGNTRILFNDLEKKSKLIISLQEKVQVVVKEQYIKNLQTYNSSYNDMFKSLADFISYIDFIKANAKTAKLHNYCKPEIVENESNSFIQCEQLRHPIIEQILKNVEYIPHDVSLGTYDKNKLDGMLVYGLNSAGKSVFMKALGISVLMAQCGMYVASKKYKFSPYESIYARISGNDNIFKGLSSFALEMTELKAILKRANSKTLVIGDEVCRGTEHISGNSIVAASLIKLSKSKASFIFATHLHEIPKIEQIKNLTNVKPFHLTVEYDKEKDILVFDRKLKEGSGKPIYGITVAKYIIDDPEFINLAQKINNQLTEQPIKLFTDKKSKYNKNIYMDRCGICKKTFKSINDHIGYLDTHHINHQKNCKDGFVVNKPHIKMNIEANLIPLCKKCHHDVHHDKLEINGYKMTTKGIKVDYKRKSKGKKNIL